MSYFSSYFFGSSKPQEKKEEETQEEQKQQDENKDTKDVNKIVYYANYVKCKAIPSVYLESSESILKNDFPELFDGDSLIDEKLYAKFKEDAEKFKKESKTSTFEDEERPKEANYYGGIDFHDSEITSLIRSSATDILKQIGKKLMSGDFNLTIVSFPIKVMIPYTILQTIARSFFQFPYYMNLAKDANPVEKLKYTIVATLSSFFCSSIFLKPLNPVLGETYEGMFSDGSKIFLEQTSHHPPNSHFEVYGPNGDWYYAGYSSFSTSAGLNSCTIDNKGKRFIKFKDGTKFEFNYCRVLFLFRNI